MKVRCIISLSILGAAGIVLLILSMMDVKEWFEGSKEAICVIGGADGPTSIIVSGGTGNYLLYTVTAVIIIITIILFIVFKRKKKL